MKSADRATFRLAKGGAHGLYLAMLRTFALTLLAATCFAVEPLEKIEPTPAPTPAPEAPAVVVPTAVPAKITFTQCNVEGPYIAITFDDGPHPTQTPRLLKMLKERGIKATFYWVGQCVAENPDTARLVVAEGHEVGNHSWSHPLLSKMAETSVHDQLDRTDIVIKQTTGVTPATMRPPYGGFTVQQRAWSYATWGYKCILWDVDSLDWKHRNPAKTQSIILSTTRPGSIILCHDIHKTTVDAMPATLDALIAKGFKFVTVSQLIAMHHEKAVEPKAKPAKTLTSNEASAAVTSLADLKKKPTPAHSAPAAPAAKH